MCHRVQVGMGVSRRCEVQTSSSNLKTIHNCLVVANVSSLQKDLAASAAPGSSGGKQAGSSTSKTSIAFGRSSSLSGRGSDSSGSKAGGTLKRGSIGQQGTRSRSAGPAARLSSSRSFSSLQGSSLAAAPFMRSSRSLSRLDRRCTGNGNCIHV